MKKIISILISILVYFKLIDKSKILLPFPSSDEVKNLSGYVYSYSIGNSKKALSNSYLIFSNPTLAIYTLLLFCITYKTPDVKCSIVGYSDIDGNLKTFKSVNYLDYFGIVRAYDDYKRYYSDISDVPFSEIENACVQFIYNFLDGFIEFDVDNINDLTDDDIKLMNSVISKYNFTTYSNSDVYDKYISNRYQPADERLNSDIKE